MFPRAFRSQRLLGALNVAGVGLSLASLAGLLVGPMLGGDMSAHPTPLVVTTAVMGGATAMLLRWRRTVGEGQLRWGWLLSFFTAWLNAVLVLVASSVVRDGHLPSPGELAFLVFATTIFGALLWVPAWMVSLVLFGAPIARAQSLASRGLAGEERGERVIATAVIALSAVALLGFVTRTPHPVGGVVGVTALVGLLAGLAAGSGAWQRERQRRALVAEAEEGRAPGYRVESVPEGKVLVRLARPADGEHGYRVADIDEELYALDEQGLAVGARRLGQRG